MQNDKCIISETIVGGFFLALAIALSGCGRSNMLDDNSERQSSEPTVHPIDTADMVSNNHGTDESKSQNPEDATNTKISKTVASNIRPQKCQTIFRLSEKSAITLTGYGLTVAEANESILESIESIETQIFAANMLTFFSANRPTPNNKSNVLPKGYSVKMREISTLFSIKNQKPKMDCTSMTFPSGRIPQWRSKLTLNKQENISIGTSPTAIIEEVRAKACYGQLATEMERETNRFGIPVTPQKINQYKKIWIENVFSFAECLTQRPSVVPHDGPSRWDLKDAVQCNATPPQLASSQTKEDNTSTGIAAVASRVDRARHNARQEIRNSLLNELIIDMAQILEASDEKVPANLAAKLLAQYWQALKDVSTIPVQCHYVGEFKALDWQPNSQNTESPCPSSLSSVASNPNDTAAIFAGLHGARARFCKSLVKPLIDKDETDVSLQQLFSCYQYCRQNLGLSFRNAPLSKGETIIVELPESDN